MFWIIIFALLMCWIFFNIYKQENISGFKEWAEYFVVCLFVTAIAGVLYLFVLMIVTVAFEPGVSYRDAVKETNIYSLRNDSGISGSFFLGSGAIDSYEYYYFYQDHKNSGAMIRGQVRARNTPIYEDNNQTPTLKTYMTVIDDVNRFWAMPHYLFVDEKDYIGWTKGLSGGINGHDLIVPEGTIIQEFRLD